jgi:SagB-type dehydrogenase family enzyme
MMEDLSSIHTRDWNRLCTGDPASDDSLWELFHENSKLDRYAEPPAPRAVYERVLRRHASLPYDGYPQISLPASTDLGSLSVLECIQQRQSLRKIQPVAVSLAQLSTLLAHSYGITRSNEGTGVPLPFRATPSAGGLYPLELYVVSTPHVAGLEPGIYHYNSAGHQLSLMQAGDVLGAWATKFIQAELVAHSSLLVVTTALFQRTVFKYKTRGYRYVLFEAGHVAQNLNLVATALKLGALNLGGFDDRALDRLLDLDGINHSTLYVAAIGQAA